MRFLPDANALVLEVVRSAVTADAGTMIPADLTQRLPYVVARRVGGPSVHPRFADHPLIDVQTWADDAKEAADLAEDIRTALYLAWEAQTVTSHGSIGAFDEISGPAEIRDDSMPDGVYRYQASYSLVLRPPTP